MILFITRKHPPSVGGMQKLSQSLTKEVGRLTPNENPVSSAFSLTSVFKPAPVKIGILPITFVISCKR